MPVPPDSSSFSRKDENFKGKGKGGGDSLKDGPANVEALRSMPVDADVERAVLSCLLKAPSELIGKSIETMNKEYFYIPAHLTIYETLLDLFNAGSDIDIIILNSTLTNQGLIDSVGGPAAIAELLDDVPTTALFDYYVDILKDKFILRKIIQGCTKNITDAYDNADEVINLLDNAEKEIFAIREAAEREGSIRAMREHVFDAVGKIEEMFNNKGEESKGLSTGFANVDAFTQGCTAAK